MSNVICSLFFFLSTSFISQIHSNPELGKMPPVFSKPHAQPVEAVTENAETETGPCLPLDPSNIINNAVANFKGEFWAQYKLSSNEKA